MEHGEKDAEEWAAGSATSSSNAAQSNRPNLRDDKFESSCNSSKVWLHGIWQFEDIGSFEGNRAFAGNESSEGS